MATPLNGISPLHMLRAELEQMRNAGRNLTQEVMRLQRSEIQLAAVVKALIGGPGMEKSIPVDVVNATIPAGLHLNVDQGLLHIECSAPKEEQPGDAPATPPEDPPPPPRILTP